MGGWMPVGSAHPGAVAAIARSFLGFPGRPLGGAPSDAELVPVRVGKHYPPGPVRSAPVIQHYRAQTSRPLNLLVPLGRGRPQVKMDAVLLRLPLRDTQEQQPRLTRSRHDQY
jgi:hypothetical protein